MPIERVGYRLLYEAGGCSLEGQASLRFDVAVAKGLVGTVYMGPQPLFGLYITSNEKYLLSSRPHQQTVNFFADATQAPPPARFFTEISVLIPVEVDDATSAGLRAADSAAQERLLKLAEQSLKALESATDFLAGTIGLRVHRYLVLEPLNRNLVVERRPVPVVQLIGDWVEIIDGCQLKKPGIAALPAALTDLASKAADKLTRQADILGWLLRAWPERNFILKFLALFTALECALGGVSVPVPVEDKSALESLRSLVGAHAREQQRALGSFLDKVSARMRPSLEERFRKLAESAGWPTAAADIKAFSAFNKVRNALIHRGDDEIKMQVTVEDNQIATLEDLVERYVCFSLFGDKAIYPSRWRPK